VCLAANEERSLIRCSCCYIVDDTAVKIRSHLFAAAELDTCLVCHTLAVRVCQQSPDPFDGSLMDAQVTHLEASNVCWS
jgi:hypothetical protein